VKAAAAILVGLAGLLILLLVPRSKGQAQDGEPKWKVCRHGPASRGVAWDAENARRRYRSFAVEVGKAMERVTIERQERFSVEPRHMPACKQSGARTRKLPVSANLPGGILFASTRDIRALRQQIGRASHVVFVDYEKIEDAIEAARDLGTKWSLGSKDAAASLGVTCVPSVVTAVKPAEVRIDEINLR
jgi:hypothetical protein